MCRCPPRHLFDNLSLRCVEFVTKPVGFLTLPEPILSDDCIPYRHMCPTVFSALMSLINCCISGIFHELAELGCSCRIHLPCSAWSLYNFIANLMCPRPLSCKAFHFSGCIFALFNPCNVECSAHWGAYQELRLQLHHIPEALFAMFWHVEIQRLPRLIACLNVVGNKNQVSGHTPALALQHVVATTLRRHGW